MSVLRWSGVIPLAAALGRGSAPQTTTERPAAPREGVLITPAQHRTTLYRVRLQPRLYFYASDSSRVATVFRRQREWANVVYEGVSEIQYSFGVLGEGEAVYEGPDAFPCDVVFESGPMPRLPLGTYADPVFPFQDSTNLPSLLPALEYQRLGEIRDDSVLVYLSPLLGRRRASGQLFPEVGATGVANGAISSAARGIIVLGYLAIDSAGEQYRYGTLSHELFHDLALWWHSPIAGSPLPDAPYDLFFHVANVLGPGYHAKPDAVPYQVGNTVSPPGEEPDTKWSPPIGLNWITSASSGYESQCSRARFYADGGYFTSVPHP